MFFLSRKKDLAKEDDFRLRSMGGDLQNRGSCAEAVDFFRIVYERNPTKRLHVGEYARALVKAARWDDLRTLANTIDQHVHDEMRPVFLHDLTGKERMIYLEICLEACQSPESIAQLCRSARYVVDNNIHGDIVECGVYKGASIVAIIRTLQDLGKERQIWLYDTFEGMPKPEEVDLFYVTGPEHDGGLKSWELTKRDDGSGGSNWVYSPLEDVVNYVAATGYPVNLLKFVKGKVEDTIPGTVPERISLLRLDTDFYRSTKHELDHLYPRLAHGGVLIIDDYGAYQGAKKATDEYFANRTRPFHLSRIDEHVRCGVKLDP